MAINPTQMVQLGLNLMVWPELGTIASSYWFVIFWEPSMNDLYVGLAILSLAYLFFLWLAIKSLRRIDFIKASGAKTVREIQNRLAADGR